MKFTEEERKVYERVDFTPWQKIKFYFSNTFRTDINQLVSSYDFQLKLFEDNKDIFEEIEESASLILGGVGLEESLNKIRRQHTKKKKRTVESYQRVLANLMDINRFYNEWNLERHEQYKKGNCKRLLLDIQSRFDEGVQNVVLLKVSGRTDLSEVERKIKTLMESKYIKIICDNKIFDSDYFIGLNLDGIIIRRGCSYAEMYEIIWDAFSYLPFVKLMIMSY